MAEFQCPMPRQRPSPKLAASETVYILSSDDDSSEDEKELYELSDERLWRMINHHPHMGLNKDRVIAKLDTLRKYLREIEESEGFEIKHFPGIMMGLTPIIPLKFAGDFHESDEVYIDLAEWAIQYYNENNGTYYYDVEVGEVNLTASGYITYYITFTAIEADDDDDESNTDGSDCETEEDNESEAVRSSKTDVVEINVTVAGETEVGGSDETNGVGSNVTGAGGSDETDVVGSNVTGAGETESGGSDETDGVGCEERKTFEAEVLVCRIGGRHDVEVQMCRLKAPRTKEDVSQPN